MIRTKIICTIGPAVNSLERMIELMKAGMNVARLNFSHGTHEEYISTIQNLKEARRHVGIPLAIMLDTKGPEIRLGKIQGGELYLPATHKWLLVKESVEGSLQRVSINPGFVLDSLEVGAKVLFNDGYISSKVIEVTPAGVLVQIENSGVLKSGKGVNMPYHTLNLPAVTEKDIEDIKFGCAQDIDMIAASFVRSADHVLAIKEILAAEKKNDITVIAKIENHEGVENFDSIVQVADGIMVARGDLGVEVPISHVPSLQKMMIRKCCMAGKPVVTATQMLESMINSPRPTRAEASDVANAIYDGTSSVMLSGETAVGLYPIETVNTMQSIVIETEKDFNYRAFFEQHSHLVYHDVPSAVTLATVKTAYSSNAQAIFIFTSGGTTARLISRLRPKMPIIAMTSNEKCFHQLSFIWGVVPYLNKACKTLQEALAAISTFAMENKYVTNGDLVVVTAGSPFGVSGTTNMMMVESIGEVLVRGHEAHGTRIHGNISMVLTSESKPAYAVRGSLIVITRFDDTYLPHLRECAGVILQNHIDDEESEKYALKEAKKLSKPIIVRADAACTVLKEGQLVTLDPEKIIVYKGVVL